MLESIAFLVRVQCRRKESSRSLSHLLMSFMFFMSQITRLTDRRTDGQTESLDRVCISCSELKKYQNQLTAGTPRPGSRLFAKPPPPLSALWAPASSAFVAKATEGPQVSVEPESLKALLRPCDYC